jgi:hypothetical protein
MLNALRSGREKEERKVEIGLVRLKKPSLK